MDLKQAKTLLLKAGTTSVGTAMIIYDQNNMISIYLMPIPVKYCNILHFLRRVHSNSKSASHEHGSKTPHSRLASHTKTKNYVRSAKCEPGTVVSGLRGVTGDTQYLANSPKQSLGQPVLGISLSFLPSVSQII
jgi:hypothetical protein